MEARFHEANNIVTQTKYVGLLKNAIIIVHCGFQEFTCSEERGGDSATVSNPELVETICQLLCLDSAEDLSFALTTLRTVTRGTRTYMCDTGIHVHLYTKIYSEGLKLNSEFVIVRD